jgi:hypothetical protein
MSEGNRGKSMKLWELDKSKEYIYDEAIWRWDDYNWINDQGDKFTLGRDWDALATAEFEEFNPIPEPKESDLTYCPKCGEHDYDRLKQARKKLESAIEVIKFYADDENWYGGFPHTVFDEINPNDLYIDEMGVSGGGRARQWLKENKGE